MIGIRKQPFGASQASDNHPLKKPQAGNILVSFASAAWFCCQYTDNLLTKCPHLCWILSFGINSLSPLMLPSPNCCIALVTFWKMQQQKRVLLLWWTVESWLARLTTWTQRLELFLMWNVDYICIFEMTPYSVKMSLLVLRLRFCLNCHVVINWRYMTVWKLMNTSAANPF